MSKSPSDTKRVCLGKIAAAHGVKGLVKILPFGDDPSLMDGAVFNGDGAAMQVTLKNKLGKYILAHIDGINDRNAAEAIRGTEIHIDKTALPALDDGEFYLDDLVGLDVVENGTVIGTVTAVENFGAEDLLDIRLKTGKSFYLPMRDDYILNIGDVITVQNHEEMIIE